MPVAGYHIGDAFVQIVASFDGVQEDVAREFSKINDIRVPVQADVDSRQFNDAVARAAKEAEKGASVTAPVSGDTTKLKSDVAKGVAEAGRTSAVVKIEGDGTPLAAKLAAIKAAADAKIVKIDGDIAEYQAKKDALMGAADRKIIPIDAQVEDYERKIVELTAERHNSSVDVEPQIADYEAKIAELKARREEVQVALTGDFTKLDGQIKAKEAERFAIDVKVDADITAYLAKMAAAKADADDLDKKTIKPTLQADTASFTNSMFTARSQAQAVFAAVVIGAPLAGSALISGLGLGFTAAALLAEKSNQQIKASFKGLQQDIEATAKAGADQLVPVFVGSANQIDATVQRLGPDIAKAMSFAGPDVAALTRGIDGLAQNSMPGLESAMQNSLPVFGGLATFLGTVGSAVGAAFASMSQHSSAYGEALVTLGQLFNSVLTNLVTLINQFAEVWAAAAGPIVGAIGKILSAFTALTSGAFPVFTVALRAAADAIQGLFTIIGPLLPVLGGLGATALVGVGAFKALQVAANTLLPVFNAASSAVTEYGNKIIGLAGGSDQAIPKFKLLTDAAKQQAVQAAASGLATAQQASAQAAANVQLLESAAAAGASTVSQEQLAVARAAATAATEAETEASLALAAASETSSFAFGPVGIAVGALAAVAAGLVAVFAGDSHATVALSGNMDDLTAALERSHGAFDQAATDALKADPDFKAVAKTLDQFGVSSQDLATILQQQGGSLDDLRTKLQGIVDAHTKASASTSTYGAATGNLNTETDAQGKAAKSALDAVNSLAGEFDKSTASANAAAASQNKAASSLANSSQYQQAAAGSAQVLGLGLGDVTRGFQGVITTTGIANSTVSGISEQFTKLGLAVGQAATAMTDHFVQADDAVVQAQQAVASANRSYQQSIQGVADSQHSLEQAQQGVVTARQGEASAVHSLAQANQTLQDSYAGVTVAENTLTRAQIDARLAQIALNKAEEQAVQDLKDLHLQLQDQVLSEEQARANLFDAQTAGAALGVNSSNAAAIAAQQVTTANEAQVKAAFAIVSAQNGVNDSLNTGAKLRKQVTDADVAGVAGSAVVVSAQKALLSAQDQVAAAALAVTKAQQAVSNAQWGVQQADIALQASHRGVADAAYALQKAHLAVRDAQDQERIASQNLQSTQDKLRDAQDAASRSLDANTKAGQANISSIYSLWDALQKTGLPIQQQWETAVNDVATAFGISKQAAQDYLIQLLGIPPGVNTLVALDTTAAQAKLDDFKARNAVVGMTAVLEDTGAIGWSDPTGAFHTLGSLAIAKALGGIVEFFAAGGFSQSMGAGVAQVVPPNSVRVIGDRSQDDEAYIPINRDPRSVAILAETANRMGFQLTPMVLGGILGFAGGAIAAAGAGGGATAAQPVSSTGVPLTVDQISALTSATNFLTDAVIGWQAAVINLNTIALAPLVSEITGAAVPALQLLEQHAGVSSVQAILALSAQLPPLRDSFALTTTTVLSDWSVMTSTAQSSVGQITAVLSTLDAALNTAGATYANTAAWINTSWAAIRAYTADPVRDSINGPLNGGLVLAWNYLNGFFNLNRPLAPVVPAFATGGQVGGSGSADTELIMATPGEIVIKKDLSEKYKNFLLAFNSGQPEALQAAGPPWTQGLATGGVVADTGSQLNAAIARGLTFAKAQEGKPYVWGGVGPDGYDCSGFMSAITNVLRGENNPYVRLGVAESQPWAGFVPGLSSAFGTGFSSVHTAGTLAGVNVESTGTHVRFGGDAHGADDGQFPGHASLPVVGGRFVSGGGGGADVRPMIEQAFAHTFDMINAYKAQWLTNAVAQASAAAATQATQGAVDMGVNLVGGLLGGGGSGPAIGGAVKDYQDYAKSQFPKFGWGPEQFSPLVSLWNKESNWNPTIANASSGAYGIPQALPGSKMATGAGGPDWRTNPSTQINWGEDYIKGRYGSPSAAWAHETALNWYDDGGWLPPGMSVTGNHTGKPEAILSSEQWATLSTLASHAVASRPDVTVYAKTEASPDHIAHVVDRHLSLPGRL